jgi:hypothetical protein
MYASIVYNEIEKFFGSNQTLIKKLLHTIVDSLDEADRFCVNRIGHLYNQVLKVPTH